MVDVTGETPVILREGAISAAEIVFSVAHMYRALPSTTSGFQASLLPVCFSENSESHSSVSFRVSSSDNPKMGAKSL